MSYGPGRASPSHRLRGPREWMALVASMWAVVVGVVFWFLPTGCTGTGRSCAHPTTIASQLPVGWDILLVAAGIGWGMLPYLLRRTKAGPAIWGVVVLLLFIPLFGGDLLLIPAAFFALLASFISRRFTPA